MVPNQLPLVILSSKIVRFSYLILEHVFSLKKRSYKRSPSFLFCFNLAYFIMSIFFVSDLLGVTNL